VHCGAAHFSDFHSRNYTRRTHSCLARCVTWTINQQDYHDTIIITNFMFSVEDETFGGLRYRTKEFCTERTIQDTRMCKPSAWNCWWLMLWLHSVALCCGYIVSPYAVATWCRLMLWLHSVALCCGYIVSPFAVATWCRLMLWLHSVALCCGYMVSPYAVAT